VRSVRRDVAAAAAPRTMAGMPDASPDPTEDAVPAADLTPVRAAAERFAARDARARESEPDPLARAAPIVLGTILGGLALAALGGLTGTISLGITAVVVGLVAAGGAIYGLVRLGEAQTRRAAAERGTRDAAAGELLDAVNGALAHVERLDAERARLHRKLDRLERRLASKDRQLARLQAFDAERRALGPAPDDRPQVEQLTLEAVLAAQAAEGAGTGPAPAGDDAAPVQP
jgi:hypothetical protein